MCMYVTFNFPDCFAKSASSRGKENVHSSLELYEYSESSGFRGKWTDLKLSPWKGIETHSLSQSEASVHV